MNPIEFRFRFLAGVSSGLAVFLWWATLGAQNPDYVLTATNAAGDTGDTATVQVLLDNTGASISSWSFGVCHDPAVATVSEVVDGATTLVVNNGGPPEFAVNTIVPGGFTTAVIICFTSCAVLPAGLDYELVIATYELVGLAPATTDLQFCNTLGSPPVNLAVVVAGQSVLPATVSGELEILGPTPLEFRFEAEDQMAAYDPANGETSFATSIVVEELPSSPGFPNEIESFALTLHHDPAFLAVQSVEPGPDLPTPDLFVPVLAADGFQLSVVFDLVGGEGLVADGPRDAVIAGYDSNPLPLTFNFVGVTTSLTWDGSLAATNLSAAGLPGAIELLDATVQLFPKESFLRGDVDDNGTLALPDALALLGFLFSGGAVSCVSTTDIDDDGTSSLVDALALLGFLFSGGPPPASPFPDCGMDFTGPSTCLLYNSCP